MSYKINIRNQANDSWINLLESQYHDVLDIGDNFTGNTVESVLSELFDNKVQRIISTHSPTIIDDSYQVGDMWINTITDSVYICTNLSPISWSNIPVVSDNESSNSFYGYRSFYYNITGNNNSAFGYKSGSYITGGISTNQNSNSSVYIGSETRAMVDGASNEIVIGANATGMGSNSVLLGNSSITKTLLRGSVGINTTSPNVSAQLDIYSTTKGLLPPRMSTVQKNAILDSTAGLVVFDTTLGLLDCYNGVTWASVNSDLDLQTLYFFSSF